MFLNFLIFLFIFAVFYFCYVYLEVNTQLKAILEKGEYESLKSLYSKIKVYNQKVWHNYICDEKQIMGLMIISAIFYGILFFSTYDEKSIKILRKNNVSVEFLEIYDRFGIERQRKFIKNKYCSYNAKNMQYNVQYFIYLYKAGEDISNYADVSLNGKMIIFKAQPEEYLFREEE